MALSCPRCGAPVVVSSQANPLANAEPASGEMRSISVATRYLRESSLPDLSALLSSYDGPPESEVPSIRQIVADGEDILAALDAQIHELESKLAPLVQKREEVAERVRRNRAIISPVRRVPAELVCEIFALVERSDGDVGEDVYR
ncbi:hypothetical protein DFH06DRAFT_1203401 [Mycena polygramma]|nr:hypothetical protein DFH06DRAFT_1203401 [Mycena polygramma]